MSNKIGAGLAAFYRRNDADDGYGDAIVLYGELPEIEYTRGENSNTNTASEYSQTRPGIKGISPITVVAKTTDTEAANLRADWASGDERKFKLAVPSEDAAAVGGVEEIILKCWVKNFKLMPKMEDETMVEFVLNVNGPGSDA